MSVGGPICQEVCEGLRFDGVSLDELYYEVVDFGCPFSIRPMASGFLKMLSSGKLEGIMILFAYK